MDTETMKNESRKLSVKIQGNVGEIMRIISNIKPAIKETNLNYLEAKALEILVREIETAADEAHSAALKIERIATNSA